MIIVPLYLLFSACHKEIKRQDFSRHPSGYYYKLISFESEELSAGSGKIAWVSASFKNQADSVFWDSFNNLNDRFYLEQDTSVKDNFLKHYLSRCSAFDSACILIPVKDFFQQQFKTSAIPFFSKKDSIIRVDFKVKKVFDKEAFLKVEHDLQAQEDAQIKHYFGTQAEMEAAKDPSGFFWVEHEEDHGEQHPKGGDYVSISYRGSYLNGRFLEKSGSDFELIYGTPDQILTGLNYVIGRLKLGENAKIILPSRLAFGDKGSSNGTVPPFTPLVYEVKLTKLKTSENAPKQVGLKARKSK